MAQSRFGNRVFQCLELARVLRALNRPHSQWVVLFGDTESPCSPGKASTTPMGRVCRAAQCPPPNPMGRVQSWLPVQPAPGCILSRSRSVVSNSLQPQGLQQARPPCPSLSTISWSLLKLMSIESVMPSNHPSSHSILLLPSIFPSIRVFSNESTLCIRWPRY